MEVLQHRSTSIFYINNRVQISLYYAYILGQLKIVPFRTGLPTLLSFVQNVKERSIKQRICCFFIRQAKKNLT